MFKLTLSVTRSNPGWSCHIILTILVGKYIGEREATYTDKSKSVAMGHAMKWAQSWIEKD